jgi:hypothetical protein
MVLPRDHAAIGRMLLATHTTSGVEGTTSVGLATARLALFLLAVGGGEPGTAAVVLRFGDPFGLGEPGVSAPGSLLRAAPPARAVRVETIVLRRRRVHNSKLRYEWVYKDTKIMDQDIAACSGVGWDTVSPSV